MSTNNLCFEQKYENYQNFSSESFHFLVVKFSMYLNRHVFIKFTSENIPSQISANISHKQLTHVVLMCKLIWVYNDQLSSS